MLLLSYLLPFGGTIHIIWGIYIGDNSKIVFGIVCVLTTLFVMGYLLYETKKEKQLLKYNRRKTNLLSGMFRRIVASFILMIVEFLILRRFGIQFRYIILIICISLVIFTFIFEMLKKI